MCRLCPRMEGRRRVFGDAKGTFYARLLFIGEAPGRRGAELTGIPLHGDQAGRNFEALLQGAGISREAVFITNATLCNPQDEKGNNTRPTNLEIKNCTTHLKTTLELVNPRIVVTLGATALYALHQIAEHNLKLSDAVATPTEWNGRLLVPLYHPASRAFVYRSFNQQQADYCTLKMLLESLTVEM